MPKITRISHLAIMTDDLEASLTFWRDALGLDVSRVGELTAEKSSIAFLPVGGSDIELVYPTTDDSGIARFLEKRGPGMHHICLEVDDFDEMLERLKQRGIRLLNEAPQFGLNGKKYAFIHPKDANGVLIELYESSR